MRRAHTADELGFSGSEAGSYLRRIDFVYHSTNLVRGARAADELEAHNTPGALGVLLERPREPLQRPHLCVCMCVCVCERERERESVCDP